MCVCVCTYCVGVQEARMAERHVLQEAVELCTRQGTPRAAEVCPQLCLLHGVLVVEKVQEDTRLHPRQGRNVHGLSGCTDALHRHILVGGATIEGFLPVLWMSGRGWRFAGKEDWELLGRRRRGRRRGRRAGRQWRVVCCGQRD